MTPPPVPNPLHFFSIDAKAVAAALIAAGPTVSADFALTGIVNVVATKNQYMSQMGQPGGILLWPGAYVPPPAPAWGWKMMVEGSAPQSPFTGGKRDHPTFHERLVSLYFMPDKSCWAGFSVALRDGAWGFKFTSGSLNPHWFDGSRDMTPEWGTAIKDFLVANLPAPGAAVIAHK